MKPARAVDCTHRYTLIFSNSEMKVIIDESCTGCSLCPQICPEVFQMGDDGFAKVIVRELPETCIESARDAEETCPVCAIAIIE